MLPQPPSAIILDGSAKPDVMAKKPTTAEKFVEGDWVTIRGEVTRSADGLVTIQLTGYDYRISVREQYVTLDVRVKEVVLRDNDD